MNTLIYDDYYEKHRTPTTIRRYLKLYIRYCKGEGFEPEAKEVDDLIQNPGLVGHVIYHAKIQQQKESI